jgi:predicted ATP-dependent serine protease
VRHEVTGPSDVEALAENWQVSNHDLEDAATRIRSIAEIPSIKECGTREIRYLVDDVLPEGAVIGLTGDSGSGKSTLACAWAGKVVARGVAALLLDRENPISVVQDRFDRLGITDGPLLRVWGGWLLEEAPQPASPIVLDWVKACHPRPLIIVDSLSAFYGGDQNDAGEMRTFMNQCRKLADLGSTVAVIHHDGQGGFREGLPRQLGLQGGHRLWFSCVQLWRRRTPGKARSAVLQIAVRTLGRTLVPLRRG